MTLLNLLKTMSVFIILLLLVLTIRVAKADDDKGPDFFQTMCQRYLILEDPDFLEREERGDLELLAKVLKARAELYKHPLDKVLMKLIEHELMTRDMIQPKFRVVK